MLLLTLGTNVLVARGLGVSGFGIYSVVIAMHTLAMVATNLGVSYGNSFFAGKGKYDLSELHTNSLLVSLVMGLLLTAGYYLVGPPLVRLFLKNVDPSLVILAIWAVPFALYISYVIGIWLGLERISLVNRFDALRGMVLFGGTVVSYQVYRNLTAMLLAWLSSLVVTAIAIAGLLLARDKVKLKTSWNSLKESSRYGLMLHLGSLAGILHLRFDIFVVNYFLGPAAVGLYSLARTLTEYIWGVPVMIMRAAAAKVIGSDDEESWRLVASIAGIVALTLAGISVLLYGLAPAIVSLIYGSDFLAAVYPLRLLLPGVIAMGVFTTLCHYFTWNLGKPQISTKLTWIAVGINVPLVLLLVPSLGVMGAALASTISYCLGLTFVFYYIKHYLNKRAIDILTFSRRDLELYLANWIKVRKTLRSGISISGAKRGRFQTTYILLQQFLGQVVVLTAIIALTIILVPLDLIMALAYRK